MKKASIVLNFVLIALIVGYATYHWADIFAWCVFGGPEDPHVVYESVSPDGEWRCTVTDVNPGRDQITYVYSIERIDGLPLSGTQYVSYEDSGGADKPDFEWLEGRVVLRGHRKALEARFNKREQHWRRVDPADHVSEGQPENAEMAKTLERAATP